MAHDLEVKIDPLELELARDVHLDGYYPSICRQVLFSLIGGKDPHFNVGNETFTTAEVSPFFKEVIDEYWKPFGLACMDELMIAGFVMMTFSKIKSGDRVPVVVPTSLVGKFYEVTVRVHPETMRLQFAVYRLRDVKTGKPLVQRVRDNTIRVISNMGWDPSVNGKLRSIAAHAQAFETYMRDLMKFSRQAEYTLQRPPFVTSMQLPARTVDPATVPNVYGDFDPNADRNNPHAVYFSSLSGDENRRFHEQVQANAVDTTDGVKAAISDNHMVNMPAGYQVASAQLPSRNTYLGDQIKIYEAAVSGIYGVPRSMVTQEYSNQRVGAAVEMTTESLRHVVDMWSNHLARIFTAVYNFLYRESHWNLLLAKLPSANQAMTEDQLFDAVREASIVTVGLSSPPTTTQEEIGLLYERKIMPWEEYHDAARALAGLTQRMPPPEPALSLHEEPGDKTRAAERPV